jgi:hypothetical protein
MSLQRALTLAGLACVVLAGVALGQDAPEGAESRSVLEVQFTPTKYAQIAVWIEDAKGQFLATVGLTEAVATRGIGNRPGASQMNSGFRWPYGRREGALPVWAYRRASAPGAKQFRRVIFQNRVSEGLASRTSNDYSKDDYFCLSFDSSRAQKDALDAVSCASVFNSDKGRFLTQDDVDAGYHEPYEDVLTRAGREQPLSLHSLYPARRDITTCAPDCFEHPDVAQFDADARSVIPDIDAVTMATPPGDAPQTLLYPVPQDWAPGQYRACVEINVEGDHNDRWNQARFPTPRTPDAAWDSWAVNYGYPYRGQPSVVYCTPFELGADTVQRFHADTAEGSAGNWDTFEDGFGELQDMDGMTDDPVGAPGSGADRLRLNDDGDRMTVVVKPALSCEKDQAPSAISELRLSKHGDELHAHQWATLSFRAAGDDVGIFRYEVRVSTEAMPDEASFMRGMPAKNATLEAEELRIPTDTDKGETVRVELGGLVALTHYYVGVRAIDGCANASAIRVAEITTPERTFATVTPCFVATAAYGTPMAEEITALRRLRDRHLLSNPVGRLLVRAYEAVGPKLADAIRDHGQLRAAVRTLLSPIVAAAQALDD